MMPALGIAFLILHALALFAYTLRWLWIALLAIALLINAVSAAKSHDHPPEHAQLHDQFYQRLRQPDKPTMGCCADKHCYPTEARFENGTWFAFRKSRNAFVPVPAHKINREPPPDGKAHLCEGADDDPQWPGILCFVPPWSGS